MPQNRTEHNRQRRFKVALAFREQTARAWAAERGVTRGHLHKVLAGERESQTLIHAVEEFIEDTESQMVPAAQAA